MLYLRICFDKSGSGVREQVLKEHREYVGRHIGGSEGGNTSGVRVVQAGPMYTGTDPEQPLGSFLVCEAESIEDVKKFHDADPFTREDLFGRTDIVRWDRHIGNEAQEKYVP